MDILLVDDNPLMQQLMTRFLGDLGYSVGLAGSANEAITLARQNPPALFVIDMYLPDLDGPDALRALRAIPGCATAPAIAMSGLDENEARRILTADFATYLPKPVDLAVLEMVIAKYLGNHIARGSGDDANLKQR